MPLKVKRGFTLVEAMISVALAAALILVISRMTVGAMQMSQTGVSHLTNLLAADVVMQQLLQDLKQATRIISDDPALRRGELVVECIANGGDHFAPGTTEVSYRLPENGRGLLRKEGGKERLLYSDRVIRLEFIRVTIPPRNASGILVDLRLSSPAGAAEEHGFRRFVLPASLPENRRLITSYNELEAH